MYRSVSSTRVGDEYMKTTSGGGGSSISKASPVRAALAVDIADHDIDDLPHLYDDPLSHLPHKKEKPRLQFPENALHIIPFLLLLCAFILWFFSNPGIFTFHFINYANYIKSWYRLFANYMKFA